MRFYFQPIALSALVFAGLTTYTINPVGNPLDTAPTALRTVLVELFTSEGCSSCPPADIIINDFVHAQPMPGVRIIPLVWHVDYHDYLGWKDPFAHPACTLRQQDYSARLGCQIYTPQAIIDGRRELLGNVRVSVLDQIRQSAKIDKGAINLKFNDSDDTQSVVSAKMRVTELGKISAGDFAEILFAITEDGLSTAVTAGENSGRKLDHDAVIRTFKLAGKIPPVHQGSLSFEIKQTIKPEWQREKLRLVGWVQEAYSRRVLAVDSIPLRRLVPPAVVN